MKRKIVLFLRVMMIACLLVCVSSALVGQNYAANLDDEKKKQEEMENELKDTKTLLKELEGLKGDTEAYISGLDKRMNELSDNIYTLEQSIEAKQAAINQTKFAISEAEKDIENQYNAMKLRIQYMYENGQSSYMSMIFDSKTMSDFLSKAEYLSQITAYDRTQLDKFQAAKVDLDAQKAKLEDEEQVLKDTLTEIEEEYAATEDLMEAKRDLIAGYNSEISSAENEMQNLLEDIETQKAIVAELEEIERKRKEQEKLNQLNKITYDGGNMVWPLPGRSYISSYYGNRPNPFGGTSTEYHNGIDIPAPQGTKIVAAYDGQVAWSYYSNSAGNWVGIDHGDGIYTVYMHMSKRLVDEGQWVKKGDVIGLVGTTGRSTGNHLHFGIRKNGAYVNPLEWVAP